MNVLEEYMKCFYILIKELSYALFLNVSEGRKQTVLVVHFMRITTLTLLPNTSLLWPLEVLIKMWTLFQG